MAADGQFEAKFWDANVHVHGVSVNTGGSNMPQLQPAAVSFAQRAVAEAALPAGSTVVDIGTHVGTVAVTLARAGMYVVAVDFSAAMVERVASYGLPNIRAVQMNGQALELLDRHFDAAFSMFGVTLFENWRAGLAEMRRVVRPGGTVSVGTWTSTGGGCAVRLLYTICRELYPQLPGPSLPPGVVATETEDLLRDAMVAAGFEDVRLVSETRPCEIDEAELYDPDRLFAFSSQWSQLDQLQRSKVLDVIREQHLVGGRLNVDSTASIATAMRPLETS